MWPNFQSWTTLRTRNFPSGWASWWLSPAAGLFPVHLIWEFANLPQSLRVLLVVLCTNSIALQSSFLSSLPARSVRMTRVAISGWHSLRQRHQRFLNVYQIFLFPLQTIWHQVFALVNNVQIRLIVFLLSFVVVVVVGVSFSSLSWICNLYFSVSD